MPIHIRLQVVENEDIGKIRIHIGGQMRVKLPAARPQARIADQDGMGQSAPHTARRPYGRGQESGRAPVHRYGMRPQNNVVSGQIRFTHCERETIIRHGAYDCKHKCSISVKASSRA